MDSASHNKKDTPTPTPPKLTRRTRRQSAEAKRKAEEETKQLKEEKRRKEMFAPRKHGRIGRYDLVVDRNLPKIYIDQEDLEDGDVKDEVKIKQLEDEEEGDHTDMDTGFEGLQQNDEEDLVVEPNLIVGKVLSMILPLLKQKDVFQCRLVNKQWRGLVDNYIEESIVPDHYNDKGYLEKLKKNPSQLCPLPKFRIVKYAYEFTRERELENFNEAMKGRMDFGLCPFVGGATITLKNLFIESLSSYYLSPATKMFLRKFGVHIRRLIIHQREMVPGGFLDCVKKCLHYVPNLERLKLIGRKGKYDESEMTNMKLELYENEMLDRTPKLNKLDTLEFQYLTDEDPEWTNYSPYLEETLRGVMITPYYLSQLKTLQLDWADNLLNFKLCNVRELSLVNLQCQLKELKFKSTVEKLTLSKPFSKINFIEIFQKFPRLRYLTIDKKILSGCILDLNLPENNIHTLEIMDMDSQDCIPDNLDFVFPKLRYLILRNIELVDKSHVVESSLDESFKNERVKVAHLICGGSSYDSKIWTSSPHLEILTFQFQDHSNSPKGHYYTSGRREREYCECKFVKGTKYECPFKNMVDTREGYRRYLERVSGLTGQCFNRGNSANKNVSSQKNCSRSHMFEKKNINSGLEIDGTIEKRALPFILPFLQRREIFKCRQVNKQWRGMVDDFIDKSIVAQHYVDEAYLEKVNNSPTQPSPLPKFRSVEYAYNFNSDRILEQFNEMMAAHVDSDLSPFVGGATITLDNLFVNVPLLRPALKEFLEEFGVHIQSLVIQQSKTEDEMDVVGFVEYVKLCLHNTPALERLKIVATCPVIPEQSEMDRIQKIIYRNEVLNRLPKLSILKCLLFEFSYHDFKPEPDPHSINGHLGKHQVEPYMDEIFFNIMIKPSYESQLEHLQISATLENISLQMCPLKELSLNISNLESKKIFEGKWELEASVEKLNLNIKSTEVELFNILQMFPSVRYLKFENSDVITSQLDSEESIIPPLSNIHTIELIHTFLSDDVFRGFPNLTFLIISQMDLHAAKKVDEDDIEELEQLEEEGELDFSTFNFVHLFNRDGTGTSYDTGIWELLPALEVIKLQFQSHDCCTDNNSSSWRCESTYVKGTRNECPFKNFVETREGYQRYCERLSRLMKQFQ